MGRFSSAQQISNQLREYLWKTVLYVLAIVGALIFIFPFLWMFMTALKDEANVAVYPPQLMPNPPVWLNFPNALTILPFATYYKNSLIITFSCMVGDVFTAALVAYGFSRLRFFGRDILFLLVLSTMLLPLQVTIVPRFILFGHLGWVDTFKPIIIPAFFGGSGFYIFLLRQFFLGIPPELGDAAKMDGCSIFGIFWRIYLPLSKPALAAVAVFSFMYNWNDFLVPLVFLNSKAKYTVQLGLNLFMDHYDVNWGLLMANAFLAALPCLGVFFFAQKVFTKGITLTGIKG